MRSHFPSLPACVLATPPSLLPLPLNAPLHSLPGIRNGDIDAKRFPFVAGVDEFLKKGYFIRGIHVWTDAK